MRNFKRIAVIIPADYGYCRGVLRGIYAYARPMTPWVFQSASASVEAIPMLRDWDPSGIIAHLVSREFADAIRGLDKPIVNTSYVLDDVDAPRVGVDDEAVGRTAAEYFMDRGFNSFAFLGEPWNAYSLRREAGFREALGAHGLECSAFPRGERSASGDRPTWNQEHEAMRKWLTALPKPVAVFASNDHTALRVAEVRLLAGLRVPEDVALLGVDDDDLICNMAYPPLSSVRLPAESVGYQAAELLSSLISGARAPDKPILLAPAGVATRLSSDTVVRRSVVA